MFDLVLKNVKLYDGTGRTEGEICDIGIVGDRIGAIGKLGDKEAGKRIDCAGLTAIPGMIDVHTHSDFAMFTDSQRAAQIKQGVTTEIISACGIGSIPLSGGLLDEYNRLNRAHTGRVPDGCDTSSMAAYFKSLPPTGVNVAAQIGHSPLRTLAVGTTKDVPFTEEAGRKLVEAAEKALDEGAVSISTGMSYYPASFCSYDELLLLAKTAAKYDVPMSVHRRSEFRQKIPGFDSKEEVLDLARDSGAKLVFSHFRTDRHTAGMHESHVECLEKGIREGLRVTADFYPYENGSSYLGTYLPFSAQTDGPDGVLEYLNNSDTFNAFVERMRAHHHGSIGVVLSLCPGHPEYLGKSINEIAVLNNTDPETMAATLLRDEKLEVSYVSGRYAGDEINEKLNRDFAFFMSQPYYNVGSDTLPAHTRPHPRSYGAFAKALRIAIDYGVGLKRFAECTSGSAAKLYGLKNRGEIREGYFADIAIFDEKKLKANSTYDNPMQYADGMRFVTVNGVLALENGEITGKKAGRGLKRNM